MEGWLRAAEPPCTEALDATPAPQAAVSAKELCGAHADRVYRFAAMVANGDLEAEDLAQDALERAIRRLDTFDPARGTLESWLWRIVVNVAADAGRVQQRRFRLLEKLERFHSATDQSVEIDSAISDAELLATVRRLPPRDRAIVGLRFGAGLSYAEVGAALGMSGAAAGVAGRRALARLRQQLEPRLHGGDR